MWRICPKLNLPNLWSCATRIVCSKSETYYISWQTGIYSFPIRVVTESPQGRSGLKLKDKFLWNREKVKNLLRGLRNDTPTGRWLHPPISVFSSNSWRTEAWNFKMPPFFCSNKLNSDSIMKLAETNDRGCLFHSDFGGPVRKVTPRYQE